MASDRVAVRGEEAATVIDLRLTPGSLVVEKYYYATAKQTTGLQWLAQVVDEDGALRLIRACRTRREALAVLGGEKKPQ